MEIAALKDFLDRKVEEYNNLSFIAADPVSVPHLFIKKQDIEIAGFFAATFAWGNRATIINKCRELMQLMDNSPHEFIVHHLEKDRKKFEGFSHRTFNATDLLYFISFLQYHYQNFDSLEDAFISPPSLSANALLPSPKRSFGGSKADKEKIRITDQNNPNVEKVELALNYFSQYFFSLEDVPMRTRKHIASPIKNSGCKRLNMFLRWMVRYDDKGVDFGLWKKIKPSELIIPLDLHVGRVAKRFHLLKRPNADWQSALSLTKQLRAFDPYDPVKYDFALFALGVIEKF